MLSQVEHVWSVCGYACVCEHVCVAVCYQKPLPEIQNIYFLFNKFPEGEVSELLLKRGSIVRCHLRMRLVPTKTSQASP